MKKMIGQVSLVMMLAAGCATRPPQYSIHVDSISAGQQPPAPKVVLLSGIKDIDFTDLQFQEFSEYTIRALQSNGMSVVTNLDEADVAVFLYYSISKPTEHQYTRAVPIFGQTGYSGSHTYGTVNTYGGGMASYSGTTSYTPTYGVVGAVQQSGTYVTFTKYISLEGRDLQSFRATKNDKQLWKTDIFSTGSSGDLRLVFPIMMAAAVEHIGKNTGHWVEVSMRDSDPRIFAIKGVPPPPRPAKKTKRFNPLTGRYEKKR